jgi:hypothetical protein
LVETFKTHALIDTGSQITTLAQWFFEQHFSDSSFENFDEILHINLADGSPLQYLGIVYLNLSFSDVDEALVFPTPVVIVSNTEFNRSCPVLIGTNVIDAYQSKLKNRFGANFIQRAKVSTP